MTHSHPIRLARASAWKAASALVLIAGTAPAQQRSSPAPADLAAAERLAQQFDSLRQRKGIPGLAVAVLRDTSIILERGFGFADVEGGIPVTPDTPFDIASVTKTIAAVVALTLAERGVLDLDRPMKSYDGFEEFCGNVRQAGGIFWGTYECDTQPLTLRHVLSMTANGTPGTRFLYNPASFSWGSRPMMQVTGLAFSTLVDSIVFQPAGMTRSARRNRRLPLRADLAQDIAKPYHTDSAGVLRQSPPLGPQGDGAAGGVISTAKDLARFDIALIQGRLLSDSLRHLMWTPARTPAGADLPYGIGWFIQQHQGETLHWHSGLWEGAYSAIYLRVPSRRLTMILLANSDGLWWHNPLDKAEAHRSPFVTALLSEFPKPR